MSTAVKKYFELFQRIKHVRIHDVLSGTTDSISYLKREDSDKVHVSFVTKDKTIEKDLTMEQLESALVDTKKYKFINIDTENCRNDVYGVISNVSTHKGVCAPFLETYHNIIYFPKLRYSDVGLLKYICDSNIVGDYKLLMANEC